MKKLLFKIIPKSWIRGLYQMYLWPLMKILRFQASQIPKYNIDNKHIANTKFLKNREAMLALLPKEGVVAELGVDEGGFSGKIMDISNPGKLHLVDFWGSKQYNQRKRKSVEDRFKQQIEEGRIEINLGLSTQVVSRFPDSYFDWIYIDTSHSYSTTIAELEAYRTKVREDGIMAGHDFIMGNWNNLIMYGVIEAVYEFCNKYNWEIIYLTAEIDIPPSFAIRRIK
jgi:hypothetical protein